MKKKLMLLVMLVSFLASGFTFLSCGDSDVLELSGTSWVYGVTKAEFAVMMGYSEATLDGLLLLAGVTIKWPLPIMKISFTSGKNFTIYSNESVASFSATPDWQTVLSGTYTISGDSVTLTSSSTGVSETVTVNGNTLTMTSDGTTMKFKKQ